MPSFRPSVHGWPFPDEYDCPAALIGLGRPVAPEFGLGGGMCWAALDRFHADRRIPRTVRAPGPEDATYAEFVLRLTNILAKDVIARAAAAQRLPATGRGRSRARVSRAEWAVARRELDAGRPVLLFLLQDAGPFADPTEGRFVLATRYDADPARAMVWTYDPFRPGDDAATLILDPGKGGEPFSGRVGREEVVHGLIAVPYDRATPPAITATASPKDERQRVGFEEDLAAFDPGGSGLGLLVRDTDAHLVCVRHDGRGWSRNRPADQGDVGADFRFEGRPVPAGVSGGKPSAVALGVNGHLLHLRQTARAWAAEDLTDQPNTGLRFRIAGEPVVVAEGRHPVVVAVNGDGRLIRYAWTTVRGWAADNLSKESGADPSCRLEGPICGVRDGSGMAHVLGRNAEGELVHFREEPDGRWRAVRPGAARAEIRRLLLNGPPVARLSEDGSVEVFARGVGDHLLRFRLPAAGRWTGQDLTEDAGGGSPSLTIASRPCLAGSAAGRRHVLGRNADGDVVHFFGAADGTWGAENLTMDRITIGARFRVEGQPSAAAAGSTVLLAGRRGAELVLYRWHGRDWTAENLTVERGVKDDGPRVASDPVIARGSEAAHIVALSPGGTVVHYRVDVPMGGGSAAPAIPSIGGIIDTAMAYVRGLLDRFRKPRKAVGLRASPISRPEPETEDVEAEVVDTAATAALMAERLAQTGLDTGDDGFGDPEQDGVAGAAEDDADPARHADKAWGHKSSAAVPWHEGDGDETVDPLEPESVEAARGASTTGPPERDLLRDGSSWSGPQLMPDADAAPVAPASAEDDWDVALRDVAGAHERALIEEPTEEVVDEQDHASARIFLDPGEAASAAGDAMTSAGPDADREAVPEEPTGTAPEARGSRTESVPGRPLVDLSFLSDIVRSDEAETGPANTAAETPANGGAGPAAADPLPPAIARPLAAGADRDETAGTHTPVGSSGGVSAPAARAPAHAQAPPVAAQVAAARGGTPTTATSPAGEPVVDLDFLASAGEYLGGGGSPADLGSFLEFLEKG
ncbi:MAG TPA: hypothetical protein VK837_14500 [Longimicrobiales bacterium]|nr:hypothetical protein [Longimicrobiales bacterium]